MATVRQTKRHANFLTISAMASTLMWAAPASAQFAPLAKPIISPAAAPLIEEAEIAETLRLAYRFGCPLIATDRMSKVAYCEVHNAFYLNTGGANAKVQAIPGFSNETMYAGAWFDLQQGPRVLRRVP